MFGGDSYLGGDLGKIGDGDGLYALAESQVTRMKMIFMLELSLRHNARLTYRCSGLGRHGR